MNQKLRGRPRSFEEAELVNTVMLRFWEQGYDQVSMDMLCKITKLSKPSFYNIFESKEALFISCFKRYQELYALPLLENLFAESDPLQGLRNLLVAAAKQFQDPKLPAGCLLLTGAMAARTKTKKIDKEFEKIQNQIVKNLDAYFEEKRPSASAHTLSQFVLSQLYSLAMFSKVMPLHLKTKEFIQTSQDCLTALLKKS